MISCVGDPFLGPKNDSAPDNVTQDSHEIQTKAATRMPEVVVQFGFYTTLSS
jgi:hypothetical protein